MRTPVHKRILEEVRAKYGAVAQSRLSGADDGVRSVAEAFGYSAEELASIPAEANMGLSCGNPTAFASLRPGETVVDLGSGGGLDVLLAAPKVGPHGRAIGIDMTPAMVERARANAAKLGLANAEFHLATIDRLPLPDASADCVISNCVINLAPDKGVVFREMHRVLKPGGRVAVTDIALKKPLPAAVAGDLLAYVGCVAGAVLIEDYVEHLKKAGFEAVQVVDTGKDLNAYSRVGSQDACCAPPAGESPSGCGARPSAPASACCGRDSAGESGAVHGGLAGLLSRYDINDFAASVKVYAIKAR
jgi:SAM-dependent methyltransferase